MLKAYTTAFIDRHCHWAGSYSTCFSVVDMSCELAFGFVISFVIAVTQRTNLSYTNRCGLRPQDPLLLFFPAPPALTTRLRT